MNTAQQSQLPVDLDTYTDMTVGQILMRTRDYYGQSLEQVEVNLNIRASQLYALENGHLENLPGRVYAIGFVRSYSEYLGLDGDKMVQLFKAQSVGKNVKPDLQFPVTYDESRVPNLFIILISLVAIVLFITYWTIFYTPTKYVEKIPPVPEILKQSTLTPAKIVAEEPPQPLLEVIKKDSPKMELVVNEDSWIEIKNAKGEKLVSQVLRPGDKYIVPENEDGSVEQGLTLSTGNAGGVTVFINGKKRTTLGKDAEVIRNVNLNPDDF